MELTELQNMWQQENQVLKSRIKLNEKVISKMKLDTAFNTFRMFLNISIVGRNLALVYCGISMVVAYTVMEDLLYSVPAVLGGLAMLWSFYHHLAIDAPKNNHELSVIELQKSIEKFRLHSISSQNYDILVVVFWLITLVPIFMKSVRGVDIYSNTTNLLAAGVIAAILIAYICFVSWFGYRKYDQKLRESEASLAEIAQFEQE
jgi:hypothetical protein